MKKIVILLLIALVCMMPCVAMADGQRTVVATTYPLYDLAKSICGDLAQVQYAPKAEAEDIKADVLLCMGSDADAWVDLLENVKVIKAVSGLDLIEGSTDALTVPVNCMVCASYFADAMGAVDPQNNAAYQENLDAYVAAMGEVDSYIRESVQAGTKISCVDGSMAYFAREYGLVEVQSEKADAELNTYNYPAEEQLKTPYTELLLANLYALIGEAN